jgi:ComF family protein
VWVGANYESAASELVKEYKFKQLRPAADSMALSMVSAFERLGGTTKQDYLVIPVPTASSRIRQRGFDHADYLAMKVAKKLGLKKLNALTRVGQTRQVGSERSIRLAQLSGQYIVKYPEFVIGRNILLVDDVVTTGATLRAATKVLRAAGATRVDALVFAKRL